MWEKQNKESYCILCVTISVEWKFYWDELHWFLIPAGHDKISCSDVGKGMWRGCSSSY